MKARYQLIKFNENLVVEKKSLIKPEISAKKSLKKVLFYSNIKGVYRLVIY